MSILDALARSSRTHRGSTAVEAVDARVTYGELWEKARAVARVLAAQDAGARVILHTENSPWSVIGYLGIVMAGAVVVPVHRGVTPSELGLLADLAGVRTVVSSEATSDIAREGMPAGTRILVLGDDLLAQAVPGHVRDRIGSDDIIAIPFTSGTTGRPKGVLTSAGNVEASIVNSTVAFGLGARQRNLVTGPMSSHPVMVGHVLTPLTLGGTVVLRSGYDADEVADLLVAGALDFVAHVPTTLGRTLRALEGRALPTSSTHMVGSASPSKPLLEKAIERFGVVVQGWGMTETTNIVTCTSRADFHRVDLPIDRLLTSGTALPSGTVHIGLPDGTVVDAEPGLEGEGVVRGPVVTQGYLGISDSDGFRDGGREFWSGDLVRIAADGGLDVIGRRKEIIISGGMNVSPVEVAGVLSTHPDCLEAAVVGVPDPDWGEAVVAVVEVVSGAPADVAQRLREHARERLSPYKRPKRVIVVDAIPHNPTGKIAKDRVHELVARRLAEQNGD